MSDLDTYFSRVCSKLDNFSAVESNGLINGRLGIAYIYAMYYVCTNDETFSERCHHLLKNIINERHQMDSSLLTGKWGLLWVLESLLDCGFVEDSYEISTIIREIANDYLSYKYDLPIHINEEDQIFSQGFCALKQLKNDDSLSSFYLKEKLILYIDECEFLLTENLHPVYYTSDLSELYIESIYFFLSQVTHLYPTKCTALIDFIKTKYPNVKSNGLSYFESCIKELELFPDSRPSSNVGIFSEIFMSSIVGKPVLANERDILIIDINRCNNLQQLIALGLIIISTYNGDD